MGGQILELASERMRRLGREDERREIILNMLAKKQFSYEEIADLVGITTEEVKQIEQDSLALH